MRKSFFHRLFILITVVIVFPLHSVNFKTAVSSRLQPTPSPSLERLAQLQLFHDVANGHSFG